MKMPLNYFERMHQLLMKRLCNNNFSYSHFFSNELWIIRHSRKAGRLPLCVCPEQAALFAACFFRSGRLAEGVYTPQAVGARETSSDWLIALPRRYWIHCTETGVSTVQCTACLAFTSCVNVFASLQNINMSWFAWHTMGGNVSSHIGNMIAIQ